MSYEDHDRCDPPEEDCLFDLVNGWEFWDHIDSTAPVICCHTHGLLAPGEIYNIDPWTGDVDTWVGGPNLEPRNAPPVKDAFATATGEKR